jgi:hypothetical protein
MKFSGRLRNSAIIKHILPFNAETICAVISGITAHIMKPSKGENHGFEYKRTYFLSTLFPLFWPRIKKQYREIGTKKIQN